METDTKEKIYSVIRSAVGVNPTEIDPNADLRNQITFDSIQYVTLTSRLEFEFSIELPISVMESRTLNDFLSIIESELARKP